jgi:hypothetical protein
VKKSKSKETSQRGKEHKMRRPSKEKKDKGLCYVAKAGTMTYY